MITYIIESDPIAWKRAAPRYASRQMYDPQKPVKSVISSLIKEQHMDLPLYEGPLELNITFFMRLPQVSKAKQKNLLEFQWHSIKPDSSNMLKLMEDICKGVLYHDDSQICSIYIKKIYGENPRTEFTIRELM